ncbi:hypothetical protein NDU88_003871 [Pleurodeles waltl]|uniref:Uncharacterized protein n=1 Tax=Pleurodeles waltl TaxID=8319 RepID=A0AAV7WTH3_PLEWA|nr:hypothetical protein NDU88_003871 [Pleurodeles waltl]
MRVGYLTPKWRIPYLAIFARASVIYIPCKEISLLEAVSRVFTANESGMPDLKMEDAVFGNLRSGVRDLHSLQRNRFIRRIDSGGKDENL